VTIIVLGSLLHKSPSQKLGAEVKRAPHTKRRIPRKQMAVGKSHRHIVLPREEADLTPAVVGAEVHHRLHRTQKIAETKAKKGEGERSERSQDPDHHPTLVAAEAGVEV
jgi:hypothetical protein